MRLIVTGGSGFLGTHLIKAAHDRGLTVLGTCHRNRTDPTLLPLDLNDPIAVSISLRDFKPDVVIHTAAQANTAFVEKKRELAYQVNIEVTERLAGCCKSAGVAFVFISTSYVFSGHNVPPGGYTPAHSPDPLLTYGEQKALAEKAALSSGPVGKTFVLRIPLLYSLDRDAPKHWLSELLRQVEAGEPIRVDDRAQRRPTRVQDACRVLLDLAARVQQDISIPPILHFCAPGAFTKLELIKQIVRERRIDERLMEAYDFGDDGVVRPLIEHLSNETLAETGIDVSCGGPA